MEQLDTVDRVTVALAGGLMLLGIVVLGAVEVLAGKPYGAVPLTDEAGKVIATPAVDPTLRTGLVIAGLVILGLRGLYRLATPPVDDGTDQPAETTAD